MNDTQIKFPIKLKRSILSQIPLMLLFLVLASIGIYLTIEYPQSVQYFEYSLNNTNHIRIAIPLFALLPLMVAVKIAHNLLDSSYTIDKEYVRAIHGICSLKKHDIRLEYSDLRGIEIERNIFARIVNVGDLKIWSLMPTEVELLIAGIRNPSKYRDIILSKKKEWNA
jgi:uncharacterized membrane protein YdbT with pleckstrin-like domain